MIEPIVTSLAASALSRMGKQILSAVSKRRDKTAADAKEVSLFLANFQYDKSLLRLSLTLPTGVTDADVTAVMRTPRAEALAFELLTVELTDSKAAAVPRLRESWVDAVGHALDDRRDFADQLFGLLLTHFEIAVEAVRQTNPEVASKLQDAAHFRRIACVLEAIDQRIARADHVGPSAAELKEFVGRYRGQVRKSHRNITPPDFDRRRDVPIEDLYVGPTIIRQTARTSEDEHHDVEDLLAEIDRTVLLGDPGNGKSTASQVLLYDAAGDPTGPVPFLVVLREFAGTKLDQSVVSYLEGRLDVFYHCPAPSGAIAHLLETGQAIVVFDGLDELLNTTHRREVTDAVSNFCNRYPLSRVLVTSRRVGYRQAPMDPTQFSTLELSGFDRDQVHDYVRKWFQQEDLNSSEVQSWADSFMAESAAVEDLTQTPLLLALMCIIYRGERSLPKNRPAVYDRCASMLFDKWDSSRKINTDLQVGALVDVAMKYLAYWLFTEASADGVTEEELVGETTSFLLERSFERADEAEAAAREFVEFCRGRAWVFSDVGTTPEGEALYKFTHRTFLEYFAAYHLFRTTDTPEDLAKALVPKVARAEWDVVAQLAVQICDKHSDKGAIRIFNALLHERRKRAPEKRLNVLTFLARCTAFVQISPSVLRELMRQVLASALGERQVKPAYLGSSDALATLLHNSLFLDETALRDEFVAGLELRLMDSDSGKSDMAMSLIAQAPFLFGRRQRDILPGEPEPWWVQELDLLSEKYRQRYLDMLGTSVEFSVFALGNRWASLRQCLTAAPDGLGFLFTPYQPRIMEIVFTEYAYGMLTVATDENGASGERREELLANLHELGELLRTGRLGGPPWLDRRRQSQITPLYMGYRQTPPTDLSADQILGLGFLVASALEFGTGFPSIDWGPATPVVQMLALRGPLDGIEPTVQPLGLGVEFPLLEAWSRSEVNFWRAEESADIEPRPARNVE